MSDAHHPEIVIIKRHARHADEHHGGAWKIAFADFMTAMMALFLVLWLISSTSEKQKRTLAQYFNPVKLVDMTTLKKGFHDARETEMGSGSQPNSTAAERDPEERRNEQVETPSGPATRVKPPEHETATASAKAPEDRERKGSDRAALQPPGAGARAQSVGQSAAPASADAFRAFVDPFATVRDELVAATAGERAEDEMRRPAVLPGQPIGSRDGASQAGRSDAGASRDVAPESTDPEGLVAEILGEMRSDVEPRAAPRLEVRATEEGVLISLTDAADATMFAIGSAEPDRKTIEALQTIAQSLATHRGTIVIRGHTDARPYRSGSSDNWRLSTARAHAARDVLVKGGLAEDRIERIEGHAHRSPRIAADPNAPENRRIEILLRKERG